MEIVKWLEKVKKNSVDALEYMRMIKHFPVHTYLRKQKAVV